MTITQEELKKLLHYDQNTGVFTRTSGKIAGSIITKETGKKYIHIFINGKKYYAHRLAWLYIHGKLPDDQIDHINGNGLDNKLENLRSVDGYENQKNRKRDQRNISGITGIRWNKKDNIWVAQITVNNKQIYLGCSKNIFEVACLRKSAEKNFNFHKNHGSDRSL